jgi:hypothetical protein
MKELFNNNQTTFNEALDTINSADTVEKANEYLKSFGWKESETTEYFLNLVKRRFS